MVESKQEVRKRIRKDCVNVGTFDLSYIGSKRLRRWRDEGEGEDGCEPRARDMIGSLQLWCPALGGIEIIRPKTIEETFSRYKAQAGAKAERTQASPGHCQTPTSGTGRLQQPARFCKCPSLACNARCQCLPDIQCRR
jgi:hypothetical protein